MICTGKLSLVIEDVPQTWIFEHFAMLPEKLSGRIKIKSIFNPNDHQPSMFIFFYNATNCWWFKDFSTGKTGPGFKMVMEMYNYSYWEAVDLIIDEYQNYIENNEYSSIARKPSENYRVSDHKVRLSWNVLDAAYYNSFNIGSKLLEQYDVRPLQGYTMQSSLNPDKKLEFGGDYTYGYFKYGELCKIYAPKKTEGKHVSVKKEVLGDNYDSPKNKIALVVSSLKDGLSLKSLNLNIDFFCYVSETALIPDDDMDIILRNYKAVGTMLDNDDAGIKAMVKYNEIFQVPGILLPMSKDISDSVRDFKPKKVIEYIVPKLDKLLNYSISL